MFVIMLGGGVSLWDSHWRRRGGVGDGVGHTDNTPQPLRDR
jgi:hypothetical protein